jgi:hypothetical protein
LILLLVEKSFGVRTPILKQAQDLLVVQIVPLGASTMYLSHHLAHSLVVKLDLSQATRKE